MSVSSEATLPSPGDEPRRFLQLGRTFLHPALDYLLIGGGLSLLVVFAMPRAGEPDVGRMTSILLPYFVLAFNSAHFAASTVRLYTRPGAFREWPFLTQVFPLVTLVVLTLSVVFAANIGRQIFALYLTWSPYHYAAQAFGLSAMYCYRSGCSLDSGDRRLLWWSCMLPFFYAFSVSGTSGLGWFVPPAVFAAHPSLLAFRHGLSNALAVTAFAAPVALVLRLGFRGRAFPAISLLLMVTNGMWWIVFSYMDAFLWATVFHGIQYLAIVTIFHVRDQTERSGNRRGPLYHALWFYGVCLALGYLIFNAWPYVYVLAGFQWGESVLIVAAIINLHHFIVDRYIWRLRRDPNYRIVVDAPAG